MNDYGWDIRSFRFSVCLSGCGFQALSVQLRVLDQSLGQEIVERELKRRRKRASEDALQQVAESCGITHATTVSDLEELEAELANAIKGEGPYFIVAKIEEADYLPVAPVEPEFTLYRFRNSFIETA